MDLQPLEPDFDWVMPAEGSGMAVCEQTPFTPSLLLETAFFVVQSLQGVRKGERI